MSEMRGAQVGSIAQAYRVNRGYLLRLAARQKPSFNGGKQCFRNGMSRTRSTDQNGVPVLHKSNRGVSRYNSHLSSSLGHGLRGIYAKAMTFNLFHADWSA